MEIHCFKADRSNNLRGRTRIIANSYWIQIKDTVAKQKTLHWKISLAYNQKTEGGGEKKIIIKKKWITGDSVLNDMSKRFVTVGWRLDNLSEFANLVFCTSKIQKHRPLQGKDAGLNYTEKALHILFNHTINCEPQAKQSAVQIPNWGQFSDVLLLPGTSRWSLMPACRCCCGSGNPPASHGPGELLQSATRKNMRL